MNPQHTQEDALREAARLITDEFIKSFGGGDEGFKKSDVQSEEFWYTSKDGSQSINLRSFFEELVEETLETKSAKEYWQSQNIVNLDEFSDEKIYKYWKRKQCFGAYLEGLCDGSKWMRGELYPHLTKTEGKEGSDAVEFDAIFKTVYHNHEAKQLQSAIDTIKALMPPTEYKNTKVKWRWKRIF